MKLEKTRAEYLNAIFSLYDIDMKVANAVANAVVNTAVNPGRVDHYIAFSRHCSLPLILMDNNKKKVLLTIGRRLFSQYGYREVTVEEVAHAAGMGTGSFYNYFDNKETFYNEILDFIEAEGAKRIEKIVGKFQSPINKLRALYRFVTLGIKHNPMLRGGLVGDKKYVFPGTELRRERGDDIRSRVQEIFVEIIREGTAKSIFRVSSYHNPKYMLTALYDAILLHVDYEHIDDLLEDILMLLRRGLKRQIRNREERVDRRYMRRTGLDFDDPEIDEMQVEDD